MGEERESECPPLFRACCETRNFLNTCDHFCPGTCVAEHRTSIFNWIILALGVGRGAAGVTGVILVRVWEPVFQNVPHSYTWALKKRTHSYTWSSKMLTYSYTSLWFFVPFFAGCYTNITVNSCNTCTKRISSLEKSLSKKYVHIPGCQKNGTFHKGIQKKSGHSYTFCWKKGANHIPGSAEKGGYSARTSVLCHIQEVTPPTHPRVLASPQPVPKIHSRSKKGNPLL